MLYETKCPLSSYHRMPIELKQKLKSNLLYDIECSPEVGGINTLLSCQR